jgi:trans-aconitate methyltransferase
MSQPEDDFAFTTFSQLGFYREVNAKLLDLAEIGRQRRIIDLGCGSGGVTELILDRLHAARETCVYAIDHSATAIRSAIANLGDRRDAAVRFVQAEVQNLHQAVKEQVDTIVYCNSIHYVPDKAAVMRQIHDELKPGGIFAFNTSFFIGGQPPDSEWFYRRWMLRSLRILRRDYGLKPDKDAKVEARIQLSPSDYDALLISQGLKIEKQEVCPVEVPLDGWIEISAFRDWIEGVMPGVPLTEGREALQKGVREVFEERKLASVPRNWLQVVASRA